MFNRRSSTKRVRHGKLIGGHSSISSFKYKFKHKQRKREHQDMRRLLSVLKVEYPEANIKLFRRLPWLIIRGGDLIYLEW